MASENSPTSEAALSTATNDASTRPYRLHQWGEEWSSTDSHPGAVFRVCRACAVRICTACAPNFAIDTACPKPAGNDPQEAS